LNISKINNIYKLYQILMIIIGVTSIGSGVGEAIYRSLKLTQITEHPIKMIGMDAVPLKAGVYLADQFHKIPFFTDEKAYIKRILELIFQEKIQLIIPGVDAELEIFAKYQHIIEQADCKILVSSKEVSKLSNDKYLLSQFCQNLRLPFAPTHLLSNIQINKHRITFPSIIKPRQGEGSRNIYLLKQPCDFLQTWEHLSDQNQLDNYILQPFYPPFDQLDQPTHQLTMSQKDEFSLQFYVSQTGYILGHFISNNWLKSGVPTRVVPIAPSTPRLINQGKTIVQALIKKGLRGPINLQGRLVYDENKKLDIIFFEINNRFTGITDIRTKLGFREVDACLRDYVLCENINHIHSQCLDASYDLTHMGIRCQDFFLVNQPNISPKKPNVMITGANGLIGSNLIIHLLKQRQTGAIIACVRSQPAIQEIKRKLELHHLGNTHQVQYLLGELPDRIWEISEDVEVIIHTASLRLVHETNSKYTERDFYRVNVLGTQKLVDLAKQRGVQKFIYLSTQQVYGQDNQGKVWSENNAPQPVSIYGQTKYIAESICQTGGLDTLILRLATIYGYNDESRMLLNTFATKIMKNDVILPVYHSGEQKLDFIHIDDLCRAISLFLDPDTIGNIQHSSNIWNIASGNPISVRRLARVCQTFAKEHLKHPRIKIKVFQKGDDHKNSINYGLNIEKIQHLLGWVPQISILDGLRKLTNI